MTTLSISDPQLNNSVKSTLTVLLAQGISTAGTHHLPKAKLVAIGLSVGNLRELITAGLVHMAPRNGGYVVRPISTVASELELFHSGDVDVTLVHDLTT